MATVDLTDVTVLHVDDDPSFDDMVATFLDREAPSIDVYTDEGTSDCLDKASGGGITASSATTTCPNATGSTCSGR